MNGGSANDGLSGDAAPNQPSATRSVRVAIRGVVQGVGFRPFVYRLAIEHGIRGWVHNGDAGVEIHAEGTRNSLESFVAAVRSSPPSAAGLRSLRCNPRSAKGSAIFGYARADMKIVRRFASRPI